MRELIEFIAKALVAHPDEVTVAEREEEHSIIFSLHVAEDDMGKVIGKQGKIAKAIRTVVRSAAADCRKKIIIDID